MSVAQQEVYPAETEGDLAGRGQLRIEDAAVIINSTEWLDQHFYTCDHKLLPGILLSYKCKFNSSLHEFQYDSHWLTLRGQSENHIEMKTNCYILQYIIYYIHFVLQC